MKTAWFLYNYQSRRISTKGSSIKLAFFLFILFTSGGKSTKLFSSKFNVRKFLNKPILVGNSSILLLLNISSDNDDKLKKKKIKILLYLNVNSKS